MPALQGLKPGLPHQLFSECFFYKTTIDCHRPRLTVGAFALCG
jgi:hypothetical protein